VLGVSSLPLFLRLFYRILGLFRQCVFMFFFLFSKSISISHIISCKLKWPLVTYLLIIYLSLDKYCNIKGLHWFGGLKLMWIFHYLHRFWMEMYSKLFDAQYCLRSVLLVEETGENHWPVANHWQTLSHNVLSRTSRNEWGSNSQL
jgi:hypothetical protein